MTDDNSIAATVARVSASGRAFLRRLEPDDALDAVASALLADDAASTTTAVLALDFDQTLKLKDPTTRTAHVRGGDASTAFLRRVHALGVALCVITAADVSGAGVRGIAGELAQLGLADLFDVDAAPAVDPLALAAAPGDTASQLLSKLAALLVLIPPTRFANDLHRIARNSVVIRESAVEFRLVRDQQRGALLRVTHPTVVHCWQQFQLVSNIDINTTDDQQMYFNDFEIDRDLIPKLVSLQIPPRYFPRLIQDTAIVHDIDGVKVARYGRVFCSKYNKPEALQLFLKQDQIQPSRIVFIDDNLTNVFNMFMQAATTTETTTQTTTCFWFKPPSTGKEESVRDEQSIALAHAFIDHFRALQPSN